MLRIRSDGALVAGPGYPRNEPAKLDGMGRWERRGACKFWDEIRWCQDSDKMLERR